MPVMPVGQKGASPCCCHSLQGGHAHAAAARRRTIADALPVDSGGGWGVAIPRTSSVEGALEAGVVPVRAAARVGADELCLCVREEVGVGAWARGGAGWLKT